MDELSPMASNVVPEMLTLAREARAMTQSDLAEVTSISQATLSKYESGLLYVSTEHLARLAVVLGYPEVFFYQAEKRYAFGSSCTYHRKRQSLPVNQLKTLLARINIFRIHVARLLNSAEIDTENRFLHLDLDDFGGDVEHIADLVRNNWRIPPGPIPNLIEAIEDAGGIVFRCSFETNKLDALSQWLPGVPPVFFVNADIPADRLRFTLAHEVAHVIMHRVPTENMEQEADRFAAEFLMPAQEIATDLEHVDLAKLAQLKPYWKVSIAALIKRAHDLNKITHRQYRSLFEQLSKLGYRLREPIELPTEEPRLLRELLEFHTQEMGYRLTDLSKLLLWNEDELREQYFPDARTLRLIM